MTKPFDPTKPVRYVNSDGSTRPARVIATDRKCGRFPVIALVEMSDGDEEVVSFTSLGLEFHGDSNYRLENLPEKRVGWVNVYAGVYGGLHKTRAEADEQAGPLRIACIKVEFEEGEGL